MMNQDTTVIGTERYAIDDIGRTGTPGRHIDNPLAVDDATVSTVDSNVDLAEPDSMITDLTETPLVDTNGSQGKRALDDIFEGVLNVNTITPAKQTATLSSGGNSEGNDAAPHPWLSAPMTSHRPARCRCRR